MSHINPWSVVFIGIAFMILAFTSGCAGGSTGGGGDVDADDNDMRHGARVDNNYGGVTIFDSGYKANATLTVFGADGALMCTVLVPESELWPDEFDPGNDVVCANH